MKALDTLMLLAWYLCPSLARISKPLVSFSMIASTLNAAYCSRGALLIKFPSLSTIGAFGWSASSSLTSGSPSVGVWFSPSTFSTGVTGTAIGAASGSTLISSLSGSVASSWFSSTVSSSNSSSTGSASAAGTVASSLITTVSSGSVTGTAAFSNASS